MSLFSLLDKSNFFLTTLLNYIQKRKKEMTMTLLGWKASSPELKQ